VFEFDITDRLCMCIDQVMAEQTTKV